MFEVASDSLMEFFYVKEENMGISTYMKKSSIMVR